MNPELPDDLKLLEAELSRFQPRQDRLDRERLIFLAGQASVSANRGWPAAFAAMTAVAATLFGLLMARVATESQTATPFAAQDVRETDGFAKPVPRATDRARQETVLSTSDAYDPDIVRLLTQGGPISNHETATPTPLLNRERDHFILTPSTWHRLFEEPMIAQPSPHDSSIVPPFRGANS